MMWRKRIATIAVGISLLWLAGIFLAFDSTDQKDFEAAKLEIVLRKIGHEILLHSGDSTSRVQPLKKLNRTQYQLTFQNEFTFQPDSLVETITQVLSSNGIDKGYIVNVINCSDQQMIFGYAILGNKKNNIVPCSGRTQPRSCYKINIKFEETGISATEKGYLIGSLPLLLMVGLLTFRLKKVQKASSGPNTSSVFNLSGTLFDAQKRLLNFSGAITELTPKENDLLLIFSRSPNEMISRSLLQKQIWEDEGVIVGRSLDMFISKLRKKLEVNSNIQLINIHGKGYKLTY